MLDAIQLVALRQFILPFNSFYYETETISDIYQNIFARATFQYIFKLPVFSEHTGPLNIFLLFLFSKCIVGIFPIIRQGSK